MAGAAPLKHLGPGAFAIVMGMAGLALAWWRAQPLMGPLAGGVAQVLAAAALLVFLALAAASLLRWQRHPQAWLDDLHHPVRHVFVAAIPISGLLLTALAAALGWRGTPVLIAWWAASLLQWAVTVRLVARWWQPGGLPWAGVTPALLMPAVGNVLAPLGGLPLGQASWAAAQFGVGVLLWPLVLVLVAVRLAQHGPWSDRLRPTAFIVIAPPAVVGSALLDFGAPVLVAWGCWGVALFGLLWAGGQARGLAGVPFALPHWGLSFPLAAVASLTLRLAAPGGALVVPALLLLALASLVVAALALATVRGLRDGTLLAPEPVAVIQPAG